MLKRLSAGFAFAIVACSAARADDHFYQGKTVSIVVGYGIGGGYDNAARLIGRHIGRHIPGNPNVIVQNMEGAGSLRAANHVYSAAPQDGTVIAAVNQSLPIFDLVGVKGVRFETSKLQLARQPAGVELGAGDVEDERHRVAVGCDAARGAARRLGRDFGFERARGRGQQARRHAFQGDQRLQGRARNPHRDRARRGRRPRRHHLVVDRRLRQGLDRRRQDQRAGAARRQAGCGPAARFRCCRIS